VVTLAAIVRSVALDSQPLWWDEGWSVYFASMPVGRMLTATASDIHPPLYYALLHWWCRLFGFTPLALRAFSVLLGTALVVSVYLLARELFGPAEAILAATLTAVAPMQVFYSQEVRMYVLLTCLSCLSWYMLIRNDTTGDGAHRASVAHSLITALVLYTEYYGILLWFSQATYVAYMYLGHNRPRAPVRRLALLSLTGSLVLHVPWIAYAGPRLATYVSQKTALEGYTPLSLPSFLWSYLSAFAAGHRVGAQQPPLLLSVTAIGLLIISALGLAAARRSQLSVALLFYLGVPLVGGYIVNVLFPFTPPFFERVLLFASPPLYVLAAVTIASLMNFSHMLGWLGLAIALLPASNLYFLWTVPRYAERDYRPVFRQIQQFGSRKDTVLCVHPWQYGYAVAYLPQQYRHLYLVPTEAWSSEAARRAGLSNLLEQSRVIWFPAHQALGRLLEQSIVRDLDSSAHRVFNGWFGSETLLVAHAAPHDALRQGETTCFEDGPCLTRTQYAPRAQSGDGIIPVSLEWSGLSKKKSSLHLSLRLADGRGSYWASSDWFVDSESQRIGLFVPWGTPPTSFDLVALVTQGGLDMQPQSQQPGHYAFHIGSVMIAPAEEKPPPASALEVVHLGTSSKAGVILEGVTPLPERVLQGDRLPVELWWSLEQLPHEEYVLFIQALSEGDELLAATETRLLKGMLPMTEWPTSHLVRDPHTLAIPARTPPGQARIIAGLLDPETRKRVSFGNRDHVLIGTVQVVGIQRQFSPPPIERALSVSFGDLATLVGYGATPCTWPQTTLCQSSDKTLQVRLLWRAEKETNKQFISFVHLLCENAIISQSDHQPGGTATSGWLPGQYIEDIHTIALEGTSACPVPAVVAVGFYDPETGQRVEPITDTQTVDKRLELICVTRP